jgi:hypothetical protein
MKYGGVKYHGFVCVIIFFDEALKYAMVRNSDVMLREPLCATFCDFVQFYTFVNYLARYY